MFDLFQDLIIEVIYADIVHGKLDQKNQQLEVDYALGRDIRAEAVPEIVSVLQDWWEWKILQNFHSLTSTDTKLHVPIVLKHIEQEY